MSRVLVTGAYGFLGRYVVRELLAHGYEVVAFGRKRDKLEALRADGAEEAELFVGDFCRQEDITAATKHVDYVIHAGALSTVWGKRSAFMETNVRGTQRVVRACKKNKVKRLVFVSSPSIYAGKCDRLDIPETDFNASNRLNYYIESKILAEKVLREQQSVPYVIIRPRGLFGIGDGSIIPRLIRANRKIGIPLFREGRNVVDISCVENVALALRLAIESEVAAGRVYNITNGEARAFREILEELFRELHEKPRYLRLPLGFMYGVASLLEGIYRLFRLNGEPAFTRYTICTLGFSQSLNIEKAERELKYRPIISLSEGIKKYARYHQTHPLL